MSPAPTTTTRRAFLPALGAFLGLLGIRSAAATVTPTAPTLPACITPLFAEMFATLGPEKQQVTINLLFLMAMRPTEGTPAPRALFTDEQYVYQEAFEKGCAEYRASAAQREQERYDEQVRAHQRAAEQRDRQWKDARNAKDRARRAAKRGAR